MDARTRLFVAILSTSLIGYLAAGSLLGRVMGDNTYGQLAVFNEVVRLIIDGYVEPIDLERTMDGASRGLLEALDGDSAYLDPATLLQYKDPDSQGSADVGVELSRRFGFLMVVAARPGSPAEKAGLRPGDIVKSIGSTHSRPVSAVAGELLLRGEPGSTVQVTLLRAGVDPIEMQLTRETMRGVPPESRIVEPGIGYVKVVDFSAGVAERLREELERLKRQRAERLVLDLRGAAFGEPGDAVPVAELFVAEGVLSRRKGRNVPEEVWQARPDRVAWRMPLVALVDTGTSGPGEVLAAALSQSAEVPLVGGHTFGRTGIQKLLPLPEGGLLVTVATFQAPDETAIHQRGLSPDVAVRVTEPEEGAEGEPTDEILEKALEQLRETGESEKAA
jgi:carboxyl-terminal processing protease